VTDATRVLRALRASQQRLSDLVGGLGDADLERATSDHGWSVAEVLSHLGSQSEIFATFIDAGVQGTEPPSNESFVPIWEAWNAKSPRDKAADALSADAAFLATVEALDEDQLAHFELHLFGMDADAATLLSMRLGEHALHSWDVEVLFDEGAVLAPDATELIVDRLGVLAGRVGQPEDTPRHIEILSSAPTRRFVLDTGAVSLEPGNAPEGAARLEISSEALVRLVYGRLDERHLGVPAPLASGVDLDSLRAIFPGV